MSIGPYGAIAMLRNKNADTGAVLSREEVEALCDTLAYLAKYAPRDLFGSEPETRPLNVPSSPILLTNQDNQ